MHPDLERAMAKRMGATTYELDSSHVPMLSQPERVIDVIRTAAKAVQGAAAVASVARDRNLATADPSPFGWVTCHCASPGSERIRGNNALRAGALKGYFVSL